MPTTPHPRGTDSERRIVVLTDHGSDEGSSPVLEAAVKQLTGTSAIPLDARQFMSGGAGRAEVRHGRLTLHLPEDGLSLTPDTVIVYEIPPADRHRFEDFQRVLARSGTARLGAADSAAWRNATDKSRTVERFARHGVPHAPTTTLHAPDQDSALAAFDRLGGDVWTRPATGLGGNDVFHATTTAQLLAARDRYAATGQKWQLSRDARNFDARGRRHQLRVVVLGERVLRVCEHVQPALDEPCNEARGARSTVLPPGELPRRLADLAIAATRALGLSFGGVDLAVEDGGCVFEVNVHPAISGPGALEGVALPVVQAHLTGHPSPHP
ncbi:RimK family alpha-L-glutamate ligase [Kitasatospora sp. NPDC127059]|uniref:ATP-grasp domain-containing protein n=1 Tax=unclassified Kitasatospora TaxID=2633591 RepID=UPI003647DD0A